MDKLLVARIQDKIKEALRNYVITGLGFLAPGEKSEIESQTDFNICEHHFFGGYEDAERVFLFIQPQDSYFERDEIYSHYIHLLRFSSYQEGHELGHRDYLGSLMGAGLKREAIGDILIYKDIKMQYADILLSAGVTSAVFSGLSAVGRTKVHIEELPLSYLHVPVKAFRELSDTVMSLRLDAVLSAAFNLSRADTKSAVERGLVKRNDLEELSPGRSVAEGDIISLRGYGKFILDQIEGETKKGRIKIKIKRYI